MVSFQDWVALHRWARALKKYKKGVELIEHDDQFSAEEKKQSADIKKSCNLNLAATYLKINDSKEARKACSKVSHMLSCVFTLFRFAIVSCGQHDDHI